MDTTNSIGYTHPPGDGRYSADEVSVSIQVNPISLTSAEAARTLYRQDEEAYRAACGRKVELTLRALKGRRARSMPGECFNMISHGLAMRTRRKSTLARLREAGEKREYIQQELDIATEKMALCARRAEAAHLALREWSIAKGFCPDTSPLSAILASASGRRAWRQHIEPHTVTSNMKHCYRTSSPSWSRSGDNGSRGLGRASRGEEQFAPSTKYALDKIPDVRVSSSSHKMHEETQEQVSENTHQSASTGEESIAILRERVPAEGEETPKGHDDCRALIETESNSTIIAKLYLALESLLPRHGDAEGKHAIDLHACTKFGAKWPQGRVATIVDPSLLEAVWVATGEDPSSKVCTPVDTLNAAWEAVCSEASRLFFDSFLESSSGQTFVVQAMDDGVMEVTKAEKFAFHITGNAHYDEDPQGVRRVVANGDEWMNSRLMHEGVEQRVRVEVAEPVLRGLLRDIDHYISIVRGELAVIVQHAYSLAALQAQRVIRGALERRRLSDRWWEELNYAIFCATVEIQRVVRRTMARRRTRCTLLSQASTSVVPLQARIRGFLVRQHIVRKWAKYFELQELVIQRVLKGQKSAGGLGTGRKEEGAETVDLHKWATLVIQRYARAWLAKAAIGAKRVEVALTSQASRLADRLAVARGGSVNGNVSELLRQVDADYQRYERVIREMKTREDEMATTFITKVLDRRDVDIAGAWKSFTSAAVKHGTALKRWRYARLPHPAPSANREPDRFDEAKTWELKYLDPAVARTLPSTFLRSTVPAHAMLCWRLHPTAIVQKRKKQQRVSNPISKRPHKGGDTLRDGNIPSHEDTAKEAVHTRMAAIKNAEMAARSDYRHLLSQSGSESSESRKRVMEEAHRGLAAVSSTTRPLESSQKALASNGTGNKARTKERYSTTSTSAISSSASSSLGAAENMSPQSFDSPTNFYVGPSQPKSRGSERAIDVSGGETNERVDNESHGFGTWKTVWDAKRVNRGLPGKACARFPGSSARQDLPSGLDETVERLCAASFLRGYVPEGLMPAGTTAEEAYQRYLELPPSLAKIRHEQLCREASKPIAGVLRNHGFAVARHLLPISKLQDLLGEAGADKGVILGAITLARELKALSSAGTGDDEYPPSSLNPFREHRSPPGTAHELRQCRKSESAGNRRVYGIHKGVEKLDSSLEGKAGGPLLRGNSLRKKGPTTIDLVEVGSDRVGAKDVESDSRWDPRRYTSRPEEWFRPLETLVKRRWDNEVKALVAINSYTFDDLYRKFYRSRLPDNTEKGADDHMDKRVNLLESERDACIPSSRQFGVAICDGADEQCKPPTTRPNALSQRVQDIVEEKYGTFFNGMTPTAVELYKYMIDNVASWGLVDDPIGTFLCQAAFYIVEHPSPRTKAELNAVAGCDLRGKRFGEKADRLTSSKTLTAIFPTGKSEPKLQDTSMIGEKVTTKLDAFRSFVQELDATLLPTAPENRSPVSCPGTKNSATGKDPRRTLIERRLEAAEVLAKPLALRLEANGVSSVKVLARTPVRIWGFSKSLVEQTERMLALLVARTCAAEYYRKNVSPSNSRGVILSANEGGNSGGCFSSRPTQQQALFDPRFQRSAFDPFGRPPRLERIYPFPGRHGNGRVDGIDLAALDEDNDNNDLPPGVWDRQAQRSSSKPFAVATMELKLAQPTDLHSTSTVDRTTVDTFFSSHCCLAEEPLSLLKDLVPSGISKVSNELVGQYSDTELAGIRPRRQPPRFRNRALRHQRGTGRQENIIMLTNSKSDFKQTSSRNHQGRRTMMKEFICREPDCGATFSKSYNVRKHERSHKIFPEYHRLKHAPQLFRDAPTAPWEGVGAPTARLRLRSELPPSVQNELVQFQREDKARKRRSLLAVPELPGVMATWAGVATSDRTAWGER